MSVQQEHQGKSNQVSGGDSDWWDRIGVTMGLLGEGVRECAVQHSKYHILSNTVDNITI